MKLQEGGEKIHDEVFGSSHFSSNTTVIKWKRRCADMQAQHQGMRSVYIVLIRKCEKDLPFMILKRLWKDNSCYGIFAQSNNCGTRETAVPAERL
jgi:hypothetical protein